MTRSNRALVIGAGGQLGAALAAYLESQSPNPFVVTRLTRGDVDVTDDGAVERAIIDARPGLVANCSAYNDVDGAETHAEVALAVNAFAVRAMARAAASIHATLVHYSTDFVFDGERTEPYGEEDRPSPLSVYGSSKLLGEWFAAAASRHYVLRVASLFGGPQARSSVDRIITALQTGREAPVFTDRIVSPSYVDDVVVATVKLATNSAPFGVYHCVNSGAASWFDLARWLSRELDCDERLLKPVSVRDVKLHAVRPTFCALSNVKLLRAGVAMPDWQDALRRYVSARSGPERRLGLRR